MNEHLTPKTYTKDIIDRLAKEFNDSSLDRVKTSLLNQMNWKRYAYNFSWFGRPIIQIPQDTVTFQEIIWEVKPDLIIETGIAHGGSLIFSASMLALLQTFKMVDDPMVVGVDIEIRQHNREQIEKHPAFKWISMIEAPSTSLQTIETIRAIARKKQRILLFLDSDHTHAHVLDELYAYAPLVTIGSYAVILDTGIETIDPSAIASDRSWGRGNSPKSALTEFLESNNHFELDKCYHEKAWVTSAPGGIIKRLS